MAPSTTGGSHVFSVRSSLRGRRANRRRRRVDGDAVEGGDDAGALVVHHRAAADTRRRQRAGNRDRPRRHDGNHRIELARIQHQSLDRSVRIDADLPRRGRRWSSAAGAQGARRWRRGRRSRIHRHSPRDNADIHRQQNVPELSARCVGHRVSGRGVGIVRSWQLREENHRHGRRRSPVDHIRRPARVHLLSRFGEQLDHPRTAVRRRRLYMDQSRRSRRRSRQDDRRRDVQQHAGADRR